MMLRNVAAAILFATALAACAGPAGQEVAGSLRIDFEHNEPDLRIPIPAVPG